MQRKYILLLAAFVLLLVTAACGTGNQENSSSEDRATGSSDTGEATEQLTFQHELGETTVEKNPENVVVFDFGALDTLDQMGVEVAGVAQSSSIPTYLSKYEDANYENVGGLKEPDFEKISEIDPDLIIISGRQQDAYEELTKIAQTLYVQLDTTNYIESFKENVQMLGQIFEKEDVVKEELAKIDEAIAALNEKATESGKNALITLTTGGKVSAYGPGSRFGLIHDVFGLEPVDTDIEASTHGQSISFEYIVEKDPDYLFVIDRDAVVGGETTAQEVIENELVEGTKAYQNDNIVYLDPNYWYQSGGGLVSVYEMVKEIEAGIE